MKRKYDLEERLIAFAIRMMEFTEQFSKTKAGNHVAGQLVRSGTSPAFNYGEVQGSESPKDFIHKMKVILKELRETRICLIIIIRKPLINPPKKIDSNLSEYNELVAIFATSIKTAQRTKSKNDDK
ncbi:MAG: four helix bundle protein, partial [Bacteroidales bacterium]